jgi:biotin operon repressor
MSKLSHLLDLIIMLQYKEFTTASELADILEVDKKTIYRYIDTLQDSNIPVESKKGRYENFYLCKILTYPLYRNVPYSGISPNHFPLLVVGSCV